MITSNFVTEDLVQRLDLRVHKRNIIIRRINYYKVDTNHKTNVNVFVLCMTSMLV
jgi:hypothetical protein